MKRDLDLIRKIMLAIEDSPTGYAPEPLEIPPYTLDEIRFNALLAIEHGLIDGVDVEGLFDLFEIRVTALTDEAVDSSFKVRVYAPGDFLWSDSFTKYPFWVGHTITLDYGSDFFEYEPYPAGVYEIELRVDFFHETSVYINVY